MKKSWVLWLGVFFIGVLYQGYDFWSESTKECAFYRGGWCLQCDEEKDVTVALKENCAICPNRQALYVAEGFVSGWQCVLTDKANQMESWNPDPLEIDKNECPKYRPLKDIVGNCYPCDTEQSVRLNDWQDGKICPNRYYTPDKLGDKSMLCPSLSDIQDAEMCVQCGGVVVGNDCHENGENHFCEKNTDCPSNEWCYPIRTQTLGEVGVCAGKTDQKWICSVMDGYNTLSAKEFCDRQNAHVPTMTEMGKELDEVLASCLKKDIWTFFDKENAIWLESFEREFLFTRENEGYNLGGSTFHALCRQN